jgi:hypothetical protein
MCTPLKSACLSLFILVALSNVSFGQKLGKQYGPVKVDTSLSVNVPAIVEVMSQKSERTEFTFSAPLVEICQAAGCWVTVNNGKGDAFRVRFKDHFTIPVKTKPGTVAYFHGFAYWDEISVEMQKHFAEDAGRSKEEIDKIIHPRKEFCFEADGIVLVRTK